MVEAFLGPTITILLPMEGQYASPSPSVSMDQGDRRRIDPVGSSRSCGAFWVVGKKPKEYDRTGRLLHTDYRSFWSIFSPAFLKPSAVFVAAFFNFRSTFSTTCFSSIFFAALENPCSILFPTFLAVLPIRSTTLRLSVGSLSANATEPEATQIGKSSQTAHRICRCNRMAYSQLYGKHTTN